MGSARNKETGCTDREEVFCRNVALDPECSDAEACRRAYPNTAKWKPESVNKKANKLKQLAHIVRRIEQLRDAQLERVQFDKDKMLLRLIQDAHADVAALFTDDMQLKPVHEWPDSFRQGIVSSIEVERVETKGKGKAASKVEHSVTKVRLIDRTARLKMLGDHVDIMAFKKQLQVGAEGDLAKALADISNRESGLPPPPPKES